MEPSTPPAGDETLGAVLDGFAAHYPEDAADVARLRALIGRAELWRRDSPLHVTGSALVLDPHARRVLLRWHTRLAAWMQVGGHAEAREHDPWRIALREATEETGLADLDAWPAAHGGRPVQIVIVPVPAHGTEPAHEHADVRYLFSTRQPDRAAAESSAAPLEWLTVGEALARVEEDNLRRLLRRAQRLLEEEDRG